MRKPDVIRTKDPTMAFAVPIFVCDKSCGDGRKGRKP